MSVYVAFYKGRPRPGASLRERVKYLFDGAIRVITRSPYSHGVRGKFMMLPGDRWDLLPAFDLKGRRTITDAQVSDRLRVHEGQKYDWLGVFRFICPILRQSKNRWFCSEFVATVLGMDNPERQTPQTVYQYLKTT